MIACSYQMLCQICADEFPQKRESERQFATAIPAQMAQNLRGLFMRAVSFYEFAVFLPTLDFHPKRSHADTQGTCGLNAMTFELLESREDHPLLNICQRLTR